VSVFFHSVPKQTDQGMTLKHPGWKNGEVEMAVTLGNSMSLQATGTINSWALIQVSLKARTIRLRNMAINALHEWGRDRWPPAAESALKDALHGEPEDNVRQRLQDLLAGRLED
jgi:hypothetical protein